VGDRLRLHHEPSGERLAFRLQTLFVTGAAAERAEEGSRVSLALPAGFALGEGEYAEVYRIDGTSPGAGKGVLAARLPAARELVARTEKRLVPGVARLVAGLPAREGSPAAAGPGRGEKVRGGEPELWLRLDSLKLLEGELPFTPARYLLPFERQLLNQAGRIKSGLGKRARLVTWALPPLILEQDLSPCRRQIEALLRAGFRSFQLGHLSQIRLFAGEKVQLQTDYTVSLLNHQAVSLLAGLGIEAAQAAIEVDRTALGELLAACRWGAAAGRRIRLGLTVYAAPALFTARLAPLPADRQILSPRGEAYRLERVAGGSRTVPLRPFSLLPYLRELRGMGLDYAVVDLRGGRHDLQELAERLRNSGRYGKLATFNYLGRLE
jgi:U32 family peptidase